MFLRRHPFFALLSLPFFTLMLFFSGCASPGRLAEADRDHHRVARMLPDTLAGDRISFLVYGDTQTGWRAEEKFRRRENWRTWKHAFFPFYQLYLAGNGFVGGINYLRGAPDYGAARRAAVRKALWNAAQDTDPAFLLHLGDMVPDDGRRPKDWDLFLREHTAPETPLLTTYPFLPVLGNHEVANDADGWANYDAVFDYPRFYAVDLPHAALFVLDSNFIVDQAHALDEAEQEALFEKWFVSSDPDRPAWLERELAARADIPFKIVAMHHPPISFSAHIKDWSEASFGKALLEKRRRLLAMLQRHGVQVILSGHEHLYEHNLLYSGDDAADVIHSVICSGGGVPPRSKASEAEFAERLAHYEAEGLQVEPLVQESVHHFSRVDVTADALVIETFEVDPIGKDEPALLDRIEIARPPVPQIARTPPAEVHEEL